MCIRDRSYIASVENKNALDITACGENNLLITTKKTVYKITHSGLRIFNKDKMSTKPIIMVVKPNVRLNQKTIDSYYCIIEEGHITPKSSKFGLLNLFKNAFKLKSKMTVKFKNPIERFPFELMYNIWTEGVGCISPNSKITVRLHARKESTQSTAVLNIRNVLIPMIGSWITQNPVCLINDDLIVEMPTFIRQRLMSTPFNTYDLVITAIKLKTFYENFYGGVNNE